MHGEEAGKAARPRVFARDLLNRIGGLNQDRGPLPQYQARPGFDAGGKLTLGAFAGLGVTLVYRVQNVAEVFIKIQ